MERVRFNQHFHAAERYAQQGLYRMSADEFVTAAPDGDMFEHLCALMRASGMRRLSHGDYGQLEADIKAIKTGSERLGLNWRKLMTEAYHDSARWITHLCTQVAPGPTRDGMIDLAVSTYYLGACTYAPNEATAETIRREQVAFQDSVVPKQ